MTLIIPSRRSFLTGLGASLVAAPAIVRAASLMPVRGIVMPFEPVDHISFAMLMAEFQLLTNDQLRQLFGLPSLYLNASLTVPPAPARA